MGITVNKNGSLHELSDISVNVSGTLYSLDSITINEGGVLRKIFSKGGSGELPASLTWNVDTTISGCDTSSKITSVSDDGLTIKYQSKGANDNTSVGAACICSNVFALPEGAVISIKPESISGSSGSVHAMFAYLYNADGTEAANATTSHMQMETLTLTAEAAGEYHIRLSAWSFTGGPSSAYYTATASAKLSFSM